MGTHVDSVKRAVILTAAMIGTLLNGTADAFVCVVAI